MSMTSFHDFTVPKMSQNGSVTKEVAGTKQIFSRIFMPLVVQLVREKYRTAKVNNLKTFYNLDCIFTPHTPQLTIMALQQQYTFREN